MKKQIEMIIIHKFNAIFRVKNKQLKFLRYDDFTENVTAQRILLYIFKNKKYEYIARIKRN